VELMADLDDIYAQIPVAGIARKLGVDEGEVNSAVQTLVPALLSGLQHNSQDPEHANRIESAASSQAARGVLDVGGGLDQIDESDGHQAVATLFGGNDTEQVASALAKGGAGDSDLIKQLLPVVLPIVLAYIGKRLGSGEAEGNAAPKKESTSGGLGEILGNILSGGSGDKSLGSILGNVLGGKGGGLGDILGGLLGGKK
jgi:hypothetical protein